MQEQAHPLELVARGAPLPTVLEAICHLYERTAPRASCSVLLASGGNLYFGAGPSLSKVIVDALITGIPISPRGGSCGLAAFLNEQVIATDVASDAAWEDYRELAAAEQMNACWSTPIRGAGREVLGTFAVYYRQPTSPTPAELEIVARTVHVAGVAIERQRVLDALRDSEERYRSLVDGLSEVIFQTDDLGRLTFASAPLETITGRPALEALGRKPTDLVHPDDRQQLEDEVERLLTGAAGASHLELRFLSKDGVERWMEWRARPQHDASGRRGLTGILADVTERKTLEAQLAVTERMASMGTLVAGVAHEINNPLASVMLNLDFIGRELAEASHEPGGGEPSSLSCERLLEPLRAATEGAERVRDIVKNLKIFSRGDERRGAVDVHEVLESTLRMTHNEVRHRARIMLELGDIPLVEANEALLGQVLINLIMNAAQAIPEGHADRNEIRITTRRDAAGRAVIEVRDSGSGIPAEHLRRIFDPFFTTKGIGLGTGLGLSICHRIVTSLGGEIRLESTLGAGTRFVVTLPSSKRPKAPRRAQSSPLPIVRRGHVLVVDDEAFIGDAVKRLIGAAHDVTALTSGEDALARIRADARYDVILCDLMMPKMSGAQLYAEIAVVAPELIERMVFITGGAFTPAARAFLDQVPNLVLEKPFDAKLLMQTVRERLR